MMKTTGRTICPLKFKLKNFSFMLNDISPQSRNYRMVRLDFDKKILYVN